MLLQQEDGDMGELDLISSSGKAIYLPPQLEGVISGIGKPGESQMSLTGDICEDRETQRVPADKLIHKLQ